MSRLAHVFSNIAFEGAAELLLEVLNDPARRGEASFKEVSDLIKAATTATATGQLLAGEASARVEIAESKKPGHDDFNAELAKLRDVTSTGCEAEKNGAPIAVDAPTTPAVPALAPPTTPTAIADQEPTPSRPDAQTPPTADGQSVG